MTKSKVTRCGKDTPRSGNDFTFGPAEYLGHVRKVKEAVNVPVIASLNGTTPEGWLQYAQQIQQAGADALELNVYLLATNPAETGLVIEKRILEVVRLVKQNVTIPVAVKLSPFFSSLAHFAQQLDLLGVDGLVLFNRFYQPDIDPEMLESVLSDSMELPLRLRWLAILSGHVRASLAVSGGVHTSADVIKSVMAGAHGVQMVSALIAQGPRHVRTLTQELTEWMEKHEYTSLVQMQASMSLQRCPDPAAFERANYMKVLQSLRV